MPTIQYHVTSLLVLTSHRPVARMQECEPFLAASGNHGVSKHLGSWHERWENRTVQASTAIKAVLATGSFHVITYQP